MTLSPSDVLRLQAQAPAASGRRDVSLIVLFLHGGLSTIDNWDMKPDAPAEFHGEFQSAGTNVAGIRVCEHLPLSARQSGPEFSLIRSFRHHNSDHAGRLTTTCCTGYFPRAGIRVRRCRQEQSEPGSRRPVIAKKQGPRRGVPAYVCLPKMHPSCGSAYLGTTVAPFVIDALSPSAPGFLRTRHRAAGDPVAHRSPRTPPRSSARDPTATEKGSRFRQIGKSGAVRDYQPRGVQLDDVRRGAASIRHRGQNRTRLRDEYGRNTLGQSCLMAAESG